MNKIIHYFVMIITLIVIATSFVGFYLRDNDIEFIKIQKGQRIGKLFSIGIYSGENPFVLRAVEKANNPVMTAKQVTDVSAKFVADPFMIKVAEKWYMFFEVMNNADSQGDIGLATSLDGYSWDYEKIVLNEPFHLSYPHVFKENGKIYMVPETYQKKEIRLYEAVNFPYKWSYNKTLIKGLNFSDGTPFKYKGHWFLFAETQPDGNGTLRLYHADTLKGEWQEHAKSPVISNNENIARPAGRVVQYHNQLIRYCQDDTPTYGNQVRAFEIDILTQSDYAEHELTQSPVLESRTKGDWRDFGMHHIDLHQLSGKSWLACVDGLVLEESARHKYIKIKIPRKWPFSMIFY